VGADRARLLVTGATGEIGGPVLARIDRDRFRVRLMTRGNPEDGDDGVEWARADLVEPRGLEDALRGVDVVLHMAAVTHSPRAARYHATNERGTAHLLSAAERAGVRRFVHVSTRAVGAEGGAYSHSKALAEEHVRGAGLPWVLLRPGEVYGGGGRDPISAIARTLATSRWIAILGDGTQGFAPVHVDDVAEATARALDAPDAEGETLTLAGPESMTYLELVSRVEAMLGVPRRRRIHVPAGLARLGIRIASAVGAGSFVPDQVARLQLEKSADIEAARRILGFAPRTLEEGLLQERRP